MDRKLASLNKGKQGSMMTTSYEEQVNMVFNDAFHQPTAWCFESGFTSDISKNRNLFTEIHPRESSTVQFAAE